MILIAQDKANHFLYGFLIFMISQYFLNDYLSFGVVLAFALGKEIKDQIVYKGFDYKDFLISIIPAVLLFIKSFIK